MTWLIRSGRVVMLLLWCFWWSGCSNSGDSARDEEKDPNYLAGRSRRAALNYTGALEAFESALESNPRSAAAHLELGLIYYQNLTTNWARAIFHFEKYLELRPKANNADLIRQNIDYCKLALAKEVPYTPNNDLVRREVERLNRDNSELRQQIEQLKGQLALRAGGATNGPVSLAALTTPNSRSPSASQVASNRSGDYALAADRPTSSFGSHESARPASASRSHVIQSGETPYSIAGKYGVKVASLLSVNPGLDPRRLRPRPDTVRSVAVTVMFNRVYFPLIALFWIVMNALLWRAEFGGGREFGSAVSTEVVWQKILTAPDDSTLEISVNGRKVGYCRWSANAGDAMAAGKTSREDDLPEGMIKHLSQYTIDVEGNLLPAQPASRVRFNLHLELETNHLWRELSVRIATRPSVWTLHTSAADETLDLKYEDETAKWSRSIAFAELREPRKLLEELSGPLPLWLLGPVAGLDQSKGLSLGLDWEARNDWLQIGHSQVRIYRLQARLLDRYQAVVIVSRVGEIMRVELPNGLLLVNEALTNL